MLVELAATHIWHDQITDHKIEPPVLAFNNLKRLISITGVADPIP